VITRTGIGYDIHQFGENRELWLGGVKIPADKGLIGHSDADVILHAIADAILGAAALGDIGIHFPNTDPKWKDVRSIVILQEVRSMVSERSYTIVNVDATLIMEKPKIASYANEMRRTIAATLNISPDQVNVKATTNEHMGSLGRGEGAAALAVATLTKR
jgi:2-C-methyl-D-erythritol 2,4-cyclodiphosphate synthase